MNYPLLIGLGAGALLAGGAAFLSWRSHPQGKTIATTNSPSRRTARSQSILAVGDSITMARGSYATILGAERVGLSGAQAREVAELALPVIQSRQFGVVVVLAGLNDGNARAAATKAALRSIYRTARQSGAQVVAIAETPWRGYTRWNAAAGARHEELRRWVLGGADGLVDIAVDPYRSLEDRSRPGHLDPQFDSGDHLHPNAAGQRALAEQVRSALF